MIRLKIIIGTLLIGLVTSSFVGGPPCGSDEFLDNCAPELGDFTYIKTFDISPKKVGDKVEVSYVFSKGSKYRVVICDQDEKGNKMKVKLYDRNKKMIASNYASSTKKYYQVLDYTCSATGVYYIKANFSSTKEGCGNVILGFEK